jgi:hypothetical protein
MVSVQQSQRLLFASLHSEGDSLTQCGSNIARDGGQTREGAIGLEKSLGTPPSTPLSRDSSSSYIQAYYLY